MIKQHMPAPMGKAYAHPVETGSERWTARSRMAPEDEKVPRDGRSLEFLGRADYVCMSLGFVLCLAISYVFSRGRIFWEDELLGWMLLRDPSWHHMVWAWKMGADGGGFAFYLTGHAWLHLFGPSEVSLRMYSAACLGLAFVIIWVVARRFYALGAVSFALFNTWFFSPWLVVHLAEGRFYGLLMVGAMICVWLAMVPTRRAGPTARYLYPVMFLAHALLVTSHLLGIVYSAFLLGAMLLLDWSEGRLRPLLYGCGMAAWLLLVPERAAIIASAAVGKPHFWTKKPTFSNIVGAYTGFSAEIGLVLLLLAFLLLVSFSLSSVPWRRALHTGFVARRPAWVVCLAFMLVPVAYIVEGWVGPSVFVNRYLMPVTLAQILLTAEAITLIDWHWFEPAALRRVEWLRWVGVAGFAAALLFWVFGHMRYFVIPPQNYTDAMNAIVPRGIPVVCEDAWQFTELIGRQHDRGVNYVYLLDWEESIRPEAPRLEVTQYHLMENWKKVGYFSGSIFYRDDFLKEHRVFLVLRQEAVPKLPGPPGTGNPLADRFAQTPGYFATPGYEVRPLTELTRAYGREAVWLVCRGGCSAQDVSSLAWPSPSGQTFPVY